MKRITKYFIILTISLFSFSSCEFSPSEIPLTEVEKPSDNAPSIEIELTPEMATLRLSEPVWITYSVQSGDREIYRINVELDDTELSDVRYNSSQEIRAYVPVNLIEDGIHELKITTYTSTNSGSIADKIGSEAYLYEIKWPVFVNKQAKENFVFYDPEFVPEGIKVSWPQYSYADFDYYGFSRNPSGIQSKKITITDPYQNSYIDSTYIEGFYVSYSIFVYYTGGGFHFDNLAYHKEIKKPLVQINDDYTVDIRWNHSENEQYVDQYCIITSASDYRISEEHDITNLNDTTVQLDEKAGFGGDYQVQLRYIPKGYDNYHSTLLTAGGLTTFALGDSVPRFGEVFYVTAENSLLVNNSGAISKYNITTGESTEAISIPEEGNAYTGTVNCSPDGIYFGYFDNQEYVLRRSSNFTVIKKMNLEAYDGYNLELSSVAVSNDGLIGTTDYSGNLRIFDATTGQNVFEKQFDTGYYLRKIMFSPDGKNLGVMANDYSAGTTSLIYYRFDGDSLTELGRVNGVGKDTWEVLEYSPSEKQQLVVSHWHSMYEYTVEVRDSHSFDLLYSVEIPRSFVPVAYDFTTDRVIARYHFFPTKKFSYLIDLKSGEQKKTVWFIGKETLAFVNGTVFSGNGRSIFIDDFITE